MSFAPPGGMQPITELPRLSAGLADASDPVGTPKDHAKPSWLAWLMGAALLASVVVVAAHVSDLREFARMMEQTKPAWLLIALALQLATYASQGAIWRVVGRAASSSIPARFALQLSIAELFVDQALPTGGVSGTAFVARVLRDRGYPRALVTAGVVARVASYSAGYALMLAVALAFSWTSNDWGGALVSWGTAGFAVVSAAIAVLLPLLTGAHLAARFPRASKLWVFRRAVAFVDAGSAGLARSPRLLGGATLLQVATILLDATTMLVLVHALGGHIALTSVFTSFMLASVFRSIGIAPGGLGTFEATSVLTLHAAGASMAVALSATLLFRGLSFWLPMIPGFWLSKHIGMRRSGHAATPGR